MIKITEKEGREGKKKGGEWRGRQRSFRKPTRSRQYVKEGKRRINCVSVAVCHDEI